MRRLVLMLVALLLAACGSGGGKKSAPTTSPATTVPETVAAGAPTPPSPGGSVVTDAGSTTSTSIGPAQSLRTFKVPSGNIGCEFAPNMDLARCDIQQRSWSPPPKPANCQLDWGQGIELSGTGPASFVCAGDTALDPAAPVLPYGATNQEGSVVCTSAQTGLTCTNKATSHGFFLSRDSYRIF